MPKALVTGASSGIGMSLARLLAQKGWELIICGRNEEALKILKKELEASGSVAETLTGDLATKDGRRVVVEYIEQQVPDLLVNNAGAGLYGDALELPIDKQLAVLALNNTAVLELSIAAAEALKKAGRHGTILNVSSVSAFLPFPGFAVYAASKAFVNQLSLAMHYELSRYGIRVLVACPGVVTTAFRDRAGSQNLDRGRMTMTADYAAEMLWWQIEKGRTLYIFDWRYRWLVWFSRYLIPRSWTARLLRRSIDVIKY